LQEYGMRVLKTALLVCVVVTSAAAQTQDALLMDTRLTVHTLVREDIFAGFMNNQIDRLAKAEQNIAVLMKARPEEQANLLAWKAGATLYRAVVAHEAGKNDEYTKLWKEASDGFAAAAKPTSGNGGVQAITGGSMAVFADRLPEPQRAAAWQLAYENYSILWKQQGAGIEQMPVHFKGEVLAGLTQSAQRTGRSEEAAKMLDKMLEVLPNTPYEATAKQWKADPASAKSSSLTCKNCHNPGRLAARIKALEAK
jgi:hypothetical protein